MPMPTNWSPVNSTTWSGVANIDALLGPYRWGSSLTYSFPGADSQWSTSVSTGYGPSSGVEEPWTGYFSPLSSSDRTFFGPALLKWSSLTRLAVNQVSDTSTIVGDIRAAYTYQSERDGFAAWAYFPAPTAVAGDIWFNGFGTSGVQVWTPGSFSNFTLLHELGHALGLKHSFEGAVRLPIASDSIEYTVMSYSAVPGNTQSYLTYYPTTPMLLDVAAIQYLYGANYAYNSGDTTYSYSDWAAAGFIDTLLRWKMKLEVGHGNKKAIQPGVQA